MNGLYSDNDRTQDRLEDQFLVGTDNLLSLSAVEDGRFSFVNQEIEIGGDLEIRVGNIGKLKTLFVVNRTDNNDADSQFSVCKLS